MISIKETNNWYVIYQDNFNNSNYWIKSGYFLIAPLAEVSVKNTYKCKVLKMNKNNIMMITLSIQRKSHKVFYRDLYNVKI